MNDQECEDILLNYLRKFSGQEVPYCAMLNKLANVATDNDKERNPVPYPQVRRMWVKLQRILNQLVKDRAVIKRHVRQGSEWTRTIRINEAFVQNPFYRKT